MSLVQAKQVIQDNLRNVAFVVGNGINRYGEGAESSSWDQLLLNLWTRLVRRDQSSIPKGISYTEFYDVLELNNTRSQLNLQKEFCKQMKDWTPQQHHENFLTFAKQSHTPVLTTNFDDIFQQAGDLNFFRLSETSFTDFYPWSCYFGNGEMEYPTDSFGLWHINGMKKYSRSIRLGLTHYMGSVSRARRMLHGEKEETLFTGKHVSFWIGAKTWLHIIFNKSLFIFGLGLEENEVFLRWLLIERAKYFEHAPEMRKRGWYVAKTGQTTQGKKIFLAQLGIDLIELSDYEEIYAGLWQ